MPALRMPDGTTVSLPEGEPIGSALSPNAIAARVDGVLRDLSFVPDADCSVEPVEVGSDDGLHVLRHSTAHVLAQAVTRLWPGTKLGVGPTIVDGFYYDLAIPAHVSVDDLPRIEETMRAIAAEDQPFIREDVSTDEALRRLTEQPFKREIVEGLGTDEAAGDIDTGAQTASFYRNDGWEDLCLGPHVPSTGRLGAFTLTAVSGAYWRGDEKNAQLTRIYGTAWADQAGLDAHIERIEQAERRDHRKLGAELDLFSFPDEIGSGLAVFHPRGGLIRMLMEDYSRERHVQDDYLFVTSPHITKRELFDVSGHLDWYADGMFPPMELDGGTEYYLKPMNCPYHILIYRSRTRSYRELPMRLFEFGSVYRYEKSGVVHGLTRVRGMTQDDAHIFTTREQMGEELQSLLSFTLSLLRDYGLDDFYLELSTKPAEKAVGADEDWEEATEALRQAALAMNLELVMDPGGGAFYGPKISVQARDAIGRTWQISTIQLDFQLPQRFDLHYAGADGKRHQPVMIHRALFGSVERFFGVLTEHYAGAFPLWLSPEQLWILPVADRNIEAAHALAATAREAGLRVAVDDSKQSVGKKIRAAQLIKAPYTIVVGDRDLEAGTFTVRKRGGEEVAGLAFDTIVQTLLEESRTRALEQTLSVG
ncbi:MAG TPA: threonine--tRNA ligase [Actinomycetota bacterium]|nr:threonine--tRNA ligase [Actinomycetota bacterium]